MDMKRIFFAFLLAVACCHLLGAKTRTVTELDSLGRTRRIIELNDTNLNGVAQTDTVSITRYLDEADYPAPSRQHRSDENVRYQKSVQEMEVAIIGILCVFLAPALILIFYLYFRYKNRQHRYRLMEQALAQGQPLPSDLLKHAAEPCAASQSNLAKGVKSACLGIGLFIFLWALTDEFGIACIGLLVMFVGFGQIIIHYLTQQEQAPWKRDKKESTTLPTPFDEA